MSTETSLGLVWPKTSISLALLTSVTAGLIRNWSKKNSSFSKYYLEKASLISQLGLQDCQLYEKHIANTKIGFI